MWLLFAWKPGVLFWPVSPNIWKYSRSLQKRRTSSYRKCVSKVFHFESCPRRMITVRLKKSNLLQGRSYIFPRGGGFYQRQGRGSKTSLSSSPHWTFFFYQYNKVIGCLFVTSGPTWSGESFYQKISDPGSGVSRNPVNRFGAFFNFSEYIVISRKIFQFSSEFSDILVASLLQKYSVIIREYNLFSLKY